MHEIVLIFLWNIYILVPGDKVNITGVVNILFLGKKYLYTINFAVSYMNIWYDKLHGKFPVLFLQDGHFPFAHTVQTFELILTFFNMVFNLRYLLMSSCSLAFHIF